MTKPTLRGSRLQQHSGKAAPTSETALLPPEQTGSRKLLQEWAALQGLELSLQAVDPVGPASTIRESLSTRAIAPSDSSPPWRISFPQRSAAAREKWSKERHHAYPDACGRFVPRIRSADSLSRRRPLPAFGFAARRSRPCFFALAFPMLDTLLIFFASLAGFTAASTLRAGNSVTLEKPRPTADPARDDFLTRSCPR